MPVLERHDPMAPTRIEMGGRRYDFDAVPVAVGTWIGAIPLLDASACFLLGRPGMAACCVGMWALARVLRPMVASS